MSGPVAQPRKGADERAGFAATMSTFLEGPMTSFYLVLGAGAALSVLGLVMVLSASSVDSLVDGRSAYYLFQRQAVWVLLGLPALWLGLRLRPATYRKLGLPVLAVSIVLLALVLIPSVGLKLLGARRWFDFGPFLLQPSEFAKLAFVLWGADLLVRKQRLIDQWRHLLVPLVPVGALVMALVMLEPDLGTTICFVLILFALLWTVGAPVKLFAALLTTAVGLVVALILVEPYRLARLTSFMDPFADPDGNGLQAIRGMYALATGGWWGVGLGNSRMKWGLLPNGHSDYIFAIIGEELGFVGCAVVLGLFATLAYAGMRIARRAADPFIRLAAAATTVWLVGQATINIGYVAGVLPVTGIPLPLISSGGTSLVLTMFLLGMLACFARHEPPAVAHLKKQGQSRIARWLYLPMPRSAIDGPPVRRPAPPAPRRAPAAAPTGAVRRPVPAPAPPGRAPRPVVGRPVRNGPAPGSPTATPVGSHAGRPRRR